MDTAVRINSTEDIRIESGRIVAIGWDTGQADFEHDSYRCGHCYGVVTLPGNPEETWS